MEFRDYINPLLRWWWLIIVSGIIAGVSSYSFSQRLPPVYQARTTLLVGRSIQDPNPSSNEFGLSYQLAGEYANVVRREPVQEATKRALGIDTLPRYTAQTRGVFLEILVTHTDPLFAQIVANELANQLIALSPSGTSQTDPKQQEFLNQQILDVQENIKQTQQEIVNKQNALATLTNAVDIIRTENDINALNNKLTTLQSIYAGLLAGTREAATNIISIFEPATLPVKPIGPNRLLIILLSVVSGFAFSIGVAYLIEFLDDTVKEERDLQRITDLPIIARIPEIAGNAFVAANHPRSPIVDAFRTLRTNLDYSSVDRQLKIILITSTEPSEGKSTVALNLAYVLAQADKKVILVDADIRSPSIHTMLKLPLYPGLSELFLEKFDVVENGFNNAAELPFKVVTAGNLPPNPTELLASNKMDHILTNFSNEAEYIIVDGPPAFVVDSLVLSTKMDGVILVVNLKKSRRGNVKLMLEQITGVGGKVVGIVLNRVPKTSIYSKYYSYYYKPDEGQQKRKEKRARARRLKLPNVAAWVVSLQQSIKIPVKKQLTGLSSREPQELRTSESPRVESELVKEKPVAHVETIPQFQEAESPELEMVVAVRSVEGEVRQVETLEQAPLSSTDGHKTESGVGEPVKAPIPRPRRSHKPRVKQSIEAEPILGTGPIQESTVVPDDLPKAELTGEEHHETPGAASIKPRRPRKKTVHQ